METWPEFDDENETTVVESFAVLAGGTLPVKDPGQWYGVSEKDIIRECRSRHKPTVLEIPVLR